MSSFRCFLVNKTGKSVVQDIIEKEGRDLPEGDVTVRVVYSSLNFKDALASTGHPGVVKDFPFVPGIDAVGEVIESDSAEFKNGDRVLISNESFGTASWGGWSQRARVPADWVLPLPDGLDMLEAMIYGTAGFTAAQSVESLIAHSISPEDGEIVVTGATGGVGIVAVKLLSKLGYQVVASTGKSEKTDWLKSHGASRVIARHEVNDDSERPLLTSRWAGAVDTVGGNTLGTILRSVKHDACITACGVVGGAEVPMTVFPFILRGVTLQGIDSAGITNQRRREVWNRIANEWNLEGMSELATVVQFDGLDAQIKKIMSGGVAGRVVLET